MLSLLFAGSPGKLPEGVRIAGVDVGGLTPQKAQAMLERRSARLGQVPVNFVSGTQRFPIDPAAMGITVDWARAVKAAEDKGDGIGIVRGFRRLGLRLFPTNIQPAVHAYDAAVNYEVGLLGSKIDRPPQEARLVRHGLAIVAVAGQTGRVLNREAAAKVLVSSLASFLRGRVVLPVRVDQPAVTVAQLRPARTLARRVLSAPVTLKVAGTRVPS